MSIHMALDDLDQQVDQLRAQASTLRKNLLRQFEAIDADQRLTTAGKLAAKREAADPVGPQLAALRDQEKKLVSDRIDKINATLGGYSGSDPTALIAFRDAQDRAEAIDNPDRAMQVLERARTSGDTVLAAAIMRRALGGGMLGDGWPSVVERYGEAYPAAREGLTDLSRLQKLEGDGMRRAAAYMPVSVV